MVFSQKFLQSLDDLMANHVLVTNDKSGRRSLLNKERAWLACVNKINVAVVKCGETRARENRKVESVYFIVPGRSLFTQSGKGHKISTCRRL
jgi:hypothetical protein